MDVLLYKSGNFVSYEGTPPDVFQYNGGRKFRESQSDSIWNGLVANGDGLLNTRVGEGDALWTIHAHMHQALTGTGSVPYAVFRAQDPTYAPHTHFTSMVLLGLEFFKPEKANISGRRQSLH